MYFSYKFSRITLKVILLLLTDASLYSTCFVILIPKIRMLS